MVENRSFFNGVAMTPNAEKIYLQFREEVKREGAASRISGENLERYLEERLYAKLQPFSGEGKNVDAELMLNLMHEVGPAKELIRKYQMSLGESMPENGKRTGDYRRLCRTDRNMLGGVCGGLAEYLQIDPTIVRIATILCSFFVPLTVLLYVALWIILPHKKRACPEVAHVDSRPLPSIQREIKEEKVPPFSPKKEPVKPAGIRFWAIVGFLVMLPFYCLATLFCLGLASYCLWGIVYPIVAIENFMFCFLDLGLPGIMVSVFSSGFLFLLFLIVMAVASRIHFKTRFLGSSGLIVVVLLAIVCIFGTISAVGIIAFQNRAEFVSTVEREFSLKEGAESVSITPDQLKSIHQANLRLGALKITTDDRSQTILVRCILKSRGQDESQAKGHVDQIKIAWPQAENFFPEVKKEETGFHFEELFLEMVLPANKNLTVSGSSVSLVKMAGRFLNVELDMHSTRVSMEGVVAESLRLKGKTCKMDLAGSDVKNLEVSVHTSAFSAQETKCQKIGISAKVGKVNFDGVSSLEMALENETGAIKIMNSEGALKIKNCKGMLTIKGHRFPEKSKNSLENESGMTRVYLDPSHIPQIKVQNEHGKVKNKLQNLASFATSDVLLEVNTRKGAIWLLPNDEEEQED